MQQNSPTPGSGADPGSGSGFGSGSGADPGSGSDFGSDSSSHGAHGGAGGGAGRSAGLTLSRPVSWFLVLFGVWSWIVWITFAKNLYQDASGLAFDSAGAPTAYFWVHLLLAVVSFLLGSAIGFLGFRGLRALRSAQGK